MRRAAALEPGHEPPRAFLHRARDQRPHFRQLGRVGRARVVPHHDPPHLLGRHVRDRVHRDPAALQAIEVSREGRPVLRNDPRRPFLLQAIARRGRRGFAEHVNRDALAYFALRGAVLEERHLRVRVQIDESRSDDETGGVDDAPRGCVRQPAHAGDAAAGDRDVACEPGVTRPIDDMAAANHDVVHRALGGRADNGGTYQRNHGRCSRFHAVLRSRRALSASARKVLR